METSILREVEELVMDSYSSKNRVPRKVIVGNSMWDSFLQELITMMSYSRTPPPDEGVKSVMLTSFRGIQVEVAKAESAGYPTLMYGLMEVE